MITYRMLLGFMLLLVAMTACSTSGVSQLPPPGDRGGDKPPHGNVPPEVIGHWFQPAGGMSSGVSYIFNGDGTYINMVLSDAPSDCGFELTVTMGGDVDFSQDTVTLTPTSGVIVSSWCGGDKETKPAALEIDTMTWRRVDEGERQLLILDGDNYGLID